MTMDGTAECEDCGDKFNRFSGYDFEGKLCNKCLGEKDSQQVDSQQGTAKGKQTKRQKKQAEGSAECEDCGEKFNRFSGYDFEGKLCNKCLGEKDSQKSDSQQSMFGGL